MTPERRAELKRLAALPPEPPELGQLIRERIDLIVAVSELMSEVEHLEEMLILERHLRRSPNWGKGNRR